MSDPSGSSEGPPADGGEPNRDGMAPPAEPCECWCMHCGRTFMSNLMWFQRVLNDPQGFEGFWMCPTPNCGGAGFTFDIFPTDPDHPANEGWHSVDDEEDDEPGLLDLEAETQDGEDWDPAEEKYQQLEAEFGDDDDTEGEEWKLGLAPGERPDDAISEGQREWEEEQRRYDQPDERPRELDWSDRKYPEPLPPGEIGPLSDDDIPF